MYKWQDLEVFKYKVYIFSLRHTVDTFIYISVSFSVVIIFFLFSCVYI